MSIQYYIRPATVNDVDALLQLVIGLATYEKEPESAKATPELFTENIFEKGYAHALLAFQGTPEAPGAPLGMALYFFNFSTWTGRPGLYLEDLFVKPEARNMGIGKALFAELGKIAQERNCGRLDWSVLTWNEPSIAFYENVLSAKRMDGWMGMRLTEEGIENLKKFAPNAN
ncbi:acyl-CoA N-acyltransferase [Melanogaster broomeanus]|nr:acyl-CoA N-acyltransferase [Melanogaster broomeanus]